MAQLVGIADTHPTRRKSVLLRLDPRLYNALTRWAADEFRSTNAQIEFLLRQAIVDAGRVGATKARGRRPSQPALAR
jgi:hypothetical protein